MAACTLRSARCAVAARNSSLTAKPLVAMPRAAAQAPARRARVTMAALRLPSPEPAAAEPPSVNVFDVVVRTLFGTQPR